jgi:hypothetical protein
LWCDHIGFRSSQWLGPPPISRAPCPAPPLIRVCPPQADAKYFSSAKKGEIADLKAELNSTKKNEKRDAVKKVLCPLSLSGQPCVPWAGVGMCVLGVGVCGLPHAGKPSHRTPSCVFFCRVCGRRAVVWAVLAGAMAAPPALTCP